MADVKWIKIIPDIFDDEKILLIESLPEVQPEADSIIIIWFKLLCLAGRQNNSGVFMLGNRPYTEQMLATIFRRKEATVKLALEKFEEFGLIERIDGVITIPNWGKHQNLDQLESKKEYMRGYMQEYREKQKRISSGGRKTNSKTNGKTNSKTNVSSLDKDKEEDKEIDKELDKKGKESAQTAPATPQQVIDLFNSICSSFPSVRSLSEARRKAIKARLNTYTLDDFKKCFELAEASAFLKGGNDRNWTATFDWLIKDANMPKVLEGNYSNKAEQGNNVKFTNYTAKEAEKYAIKRSYSDPFAEKKTAGNDEAVRAKAEALKARLS